MPPLFGIAVACALGCVLALLGAPLLARIAHWCGAVDLPDGHRKHHDHAIPRCGGVTMALAGLLAFGATLAYFTDPVATLADEAWLVRGLAPAALVLLLVGVLDDVFSLTGIYKLIGQFLAVSILVASDRAVESISIAGFAIPLGGLALPFVIFFYLGAVNSFNLIDGIDGLASSLGALVLATLGCIAAAQGYTAAALLCFALVGGLVGFLRFNLPPARMYLGDTGSMLIGLVVGAVAVHCSIKTQAAFALGAPLAVCALPILDASAAIIRRITTGQSVFAPDRGHLHHAFLQRGLSVGQTVATLSALTAATCASALLSYFTSNDLFALVFSASIVASLAVSRTFGHSECALVAGRVRSLFSRFTPGGHSRSQRGVESTVRLQGHAQWRDVWKMLRENAPKFGVVGVQMQVTIPRLHESFFATWQDSAEAGPELAPWRVTTPIRFGDRTVGRLAVTGRSQADSTTSDMQQFLEFAEVVNSEIVRMLASPQPAVVTSMPLPDESSGSISAVPLAVRPGEVESTPVAN
jgi:UDP-GlcNAc:undecaprenyl-phosphate/decaprenyl-phosphate GlcNAc-1-phosphate transferase